MGVDPGGDGGQVFSQIWSRRDTDIDVPQSFSLFCAFVHMILWCNAIITFSHASEAYTIKLGQSQVLDILRHLGSDPRKFVMDRRYWYETWNLQRSMWRTFKVTGPNRPEVETQGGNRKKSGRPSRSCQLHCTFQCYLALTVFCNPSADNYLADDDSLVRQVGAHWPPGPSVPSLSD